MAVLTNKLYIKNSAGTQETCNIYSTTAEAGSNYLTVKIGSTTGYVRLASTSDYYASKGRVTKSGTTYAICKQKMPTASKKSTISNSITNIAGAVTTVGNYALYLGVGTPGQYINSSLTQGNVSIVNINLYGSMAATTVGNYALFGGGQWFSTESFVNVATDAMFACNSSLTVSTPTKLSSARTIPTATTVGNYALFAGGSTAPSTVAAGRVATVDAYNKSLTRSTATALSQARYALAATSIGNYALIAGGQTTDDVSQGGVSTIDVYNTSLTRSNTISLSAGRAGIAGTKNARYAIFAGGENGASSYNTIDAFNSSLTKNTSATLSIACGYSAASTLGTLYAIVAGGKTHSDSYNNAVNCYDPSLTRSSLTALSSVKANIKATHVGNYAIVTGGPKSSTQNNNDTTVDVYQVA